MDKERAFLEIFNRIMGTSFVKADMHLTRSQIPAWDSLRHVLLILELQEELNVQIETSQAIAIVSIQDTYDLVSTQK